MKIRPAILSIVVILIVLVILFFTSETAVLFFGIISCQLSSNCAGTSQDASLILAKAIESQDVKICDQLPKNILLSATTPRADCYFDYAQETQDVDMCLLNVYSSQKGGGLECYIGIAIKIKDLALCKALPSKFSYLENIHEDLLKIYGYAERDQRLTQCYVGIAKSLNDSSVCGNLEGDYRLWCSIPFSDRSICNQFATERGREFCEEGFNRSSPDTFPLSPPLFY